MTGINSRRVWLGALGGWVVWMIWSMAINLGVLATGYAEAQKSGMLLTEPRYGFFLPAWFVTLFLLSCVLAWVYAGVRTTYGPGPGTAIKVGVLVGFAAGFPLAFSTAAWSPLARLFPLWWMVELWVGAVLSAYVSAWLYRES